PPRSPDRQSEPVQTVHSMGHRRIGKRSAWYAPEYTQRSVDPSGQAIWLEGTPRAVWAGMSSPSADPVVAQLVLRLWEVSASLVPSVLMPSSASSSATRSRPCCSKSARRLGSALPWTRWAASVMESESRFSILVRASKNMVAMRWGVILSFDVLLVPV